MTKKKGFRGNPQTHRLNAHGIHNERAFASSSPSMINVQARAVTPIQKSHSYSDRSEPSGKVNNGGYVDEYLVLVEKKTVEEATIKPGDEIEMTFAGAPNDFPRPWTLVSARDEYSTVSYSNTPTVVVRAANGKEMTLKNAQVYSPHKPEKSFGYWVKPKGLPPRYEKYVTIQDEVTLLELIKKEDQGGINEYIEKMYERSGIDKKKYPLNFFRVDVINGLWYKGLVKQKNSRMAISKHGEKVLKSGAFGSAQMRDWEKNKVVKMDDEDIEIFDAKTQKMIRKYMKKGNLYYMFGFLVFEDDKSLRIVGENDSYDDYTIRMRTKDFDKVYDRLENADGGVYATTEGWK